MGLTLVGTGLWDETDITIKGLAELEQSDLVFAELYTNEVRSGKLARIEKMCGKHITLLSREEVEDGKRILYEAARKKVALLVSGDPMISTTHVSLKIEAYKRAVPFKVVHAASILSAAISASGLHAYKFGRSVTLPFWSERYKPTSTYDVLLQNKSLGLHTLLFLDIKDGKTMTAMEAFSLLQKLEKAKKKRLVNKDMGLVVLSRIGSHDEAVTFGTLSRLKALPEGRLGETPSIIIVPGDLHFTEREALDLLVPEAV